MRREVVGGRCPVRFGTPAAPRRWRRVAHGLAANSRSSSARFGGILSNLGTTGRLNPDPRVSGFLCDPDRGRAEASIGPCPRGDFGRSRVTARRDCSSERRLGTAADDVENERSPGSGLSASRVGGVCAPRSRTSECPGPRGCRLRCGCCRCRAPAASVGRCGGPCPTPVPCTLLDRARCVVGHLDSPDSAARPCACQPEARSRAVLRARPCDRVCGRSFFFVHRRWMSGAVPVCRCRLLPSLESAPDALWLLRVSWMPWAPPRPVP